MTLGLLYSSFEGVVHFEVTMKLLMNKASLEVYISSEYTFLLSRSSFKEVLPSNSIQFENLKNFSTLQMVKYS